MSEEIVDASADDFNTHFMSSVNEIINVILTFDPRNGFVLSIPNNFNTKFSLNAYNSHILSKYCK